MSGCKVANEELVESVRAAAMHADMSFHSIVGAKSLYKCAYSEFTIYMYMAETQIACN